MEDKYKCITERKMTSDLEHYEKMKLKSKKHEILVMMRKVTDEQEQEKLRRNELYSEWLRFMYALLVIPAIKNRMTVRVLQSPDN